MGNRTNSPSSCVVNQFSISGAGFFMKGKRDILGKISLPAQRSRIENLLSMKREVGNQFTRLPTK